MQQLGVSTALAQEQARTAQDMAGLAEWLQRSLLTPPPPIADLEIAAAYVPAADHVKIGGDWYDVFPAPGERTLVVIGDVAGHDGAAAATMAQVRSVLRGMGKVLLAPPATLLTALDRAVRSFLPDVFATVIVIEISRLGRSSGPLVLRWSNAGHPPPVLISGDDGTARLLEREPDLLLGVDPDTRRADHELVLYQGDTVVLYTDGLVERRGATIDEGLLRLRDVATDEAGLPLDKLCEVLLAACTERPDDDIAVLALRARAQ